MMVDQQLSMKVAMEKKKKTSPECWMQCEVKYGSLKDNSHTAALILSPQHSQTMWASPSSVQYTQLTMFIISLSVSDQNKVLYGGLRAHNRWMPIMLMKYCRNIVTHAICCDKKRCLHAV